LFRFSADARKAADPRGRLLTKGGFLQWVGHRSTVMDGDGVAVSLDLLPALPATLAFEFEQ